MAKRSRLRAIDVCELPPRYLEPLLDRTIRVSDEARFVDLLHDFGFPVYWLYGEDEWWAEQA